MEPVLRPLTGPAEERVFPSIGHNIPAEAPQAVAQALIDLMRRET